MEKGVPLEPQCWALRLAFYVIWDAQGYEAMKTI
jgi:hypothetical protein